MNTDNGKRLVEAFAEAKALHKLIGTDKAGNMDWLEYPEKYPYTAEATTPAEAIMRAAAKVRAALGEGGQEHD